MHIFVLTVVQHKLLSDTEGNSHQHQSKEELWTQNKPSA